jgi:methylmalonyl-CoA mutase C-terminal domain/subunit
MIAAAASQEDVDAIGLSILSGAHLELFPPIIRGLQERGVGDIPVFCGGIIPKEDQAALSALGIKAVFGPGTSLQQIVDFVTRLVSEGSAATSGQR